MDDPLNLCPASGWDIQHRTFHEEKEAYAKLSHLVDVISTWTTRVHE